MRKIKLALDALAVESFPTTAEARPPRGTVAGNEYSQMESCDRLCDTTTNLGHTCAEATCGSDPNVCGTQGAGPSCWDECVITVGPDVCLSEISGCYFCQ